MGLEGGPFIGREAAGEVFAEQGLERVGVGGRRLGRKWGGHWSVSRKRVKPRERMPRRAPLERPMARQMCA